MTQQQRNQLRFLLTANSKVNKVTYLRSIILNLTSDGERREDNTRRGGKEQGKERGKGREGGEERRKRLQIT